VRGVPNGVGHSCRPTTPLTYPSGCAFFFSCAALQIQLRDDVRLVAIEVWSHRKHRTLSEHASVSNLNDNDSHYVYRLPKSIDGCTELKDVVLYHRNVRARPVCQTRCPGCWNCNCQPSIFQVCSHPTL